MKIKESHLKFGGEVDFGYWGERHNRFRISLRWNKKKQQYEVYKHYFRTKTDEVVFSGKELGAAVKNACDIANGYAEKVYGEPIFKDVAEAEER